jgi:two-component system LytT family sensor kinase
VLGTLVYGLIWLLTPVVFWLAVNVELTTGPRGQLLALLVHAAASVGFTVFFRGVYVAELVLVGAPDIVFSWAMVLASVNVWLPGYWMLLCVAYALDFYVRYHCRNLDAAHLEMQLQPHFLFNTLHAIATLLPRQCEALPA